MEPKESNSKLYIKMPNGEMLSVKECVDINASCGENIESELTKIDTTIGYDIHMEFKTHFTVKTILALLGIPTSNNWRKIHGGIMDRNRYKRKK